MAVKSKIKRQQKYVRPSLTASDILKVNHPLHPSLVKFCRHNPITKRQASKFLRKYPHYQQ